MSYNEARIQLGLWHWCYLWAGVGDVDDDAEFAAVNGHGIYGKQLADDLDGYLPNSRMRQLLKSVLIFPTNEAANA